MGSRQCPNIRKGCHPTAVQHSNSLVRHESRFIDSVNKPEEAAVFLLGAPLDGTVSFWPGTRFAPTRIRNVSHALEGYSPLLDRSLQEVPFYDAGDIDIPLGNVAGALNAIESTVGEQVLALGKRPFILGGEHLISLPIIKAIHSLYTDLAVVQFDAHADLRETYLGEVRSHATVMRRVSELLGSENLYQLGIRSGTREEFRYGYRNTRFFPHEVLGPLCSVLPELRDRPVYVTLDIDVIDPGFAPGVGTPEPGGCTPQQITEALHLLAPVRVVGFDLVEVCPPAEAGVTTSVLAAKLVREAILSFGR